MPLTLMDTGVETTVKSIRGKDQTRKFLQNLGFVEGAKVTVVSSLAGNVIVNVKDARVAISEQMASRIMVFLQRGQTQMSNLRHTPVGATVTVRKIEGEGATRRRIMDMGITRGAEIYVRKVAPLGDPVEITVRGYELSLRKADAEMIQVD